MAKLIFRYGAMGSSKTANALMTRYNYMERGQKVVLLKPAIENRDGEKTIKSRIGIDAECEIAEDFLEKMKTWTSAPAYAAVIVDEAQFLSEESIDLLSDIVDTYGITVICYGLRTDFMGKLFTGSKRLFEMADIIEEIPTICWCGRKARCNARISNGKIVRTGEQIQMGGNESYISLCRKHFKEGRISE